MRRYAIITVDVTPRWLCGHTHRDSDVTADTLAVALAHQRIEALLRAASPECAYLTGVCTALAVELENLHHIRLLGLKGDRLLLCGVYGDACVLAAARKLKQRGYTVALLEDVCLWSAPLPMLLECEETAQTLAQVPRLKAIDLWPQLAEFAADDSQPGLWAGDPPNLQT